MFDKISLRLLWFIRDIRWNSYSRIDKTKILDIMYWVYTHEGKRKASRRSFSNYVCKKRNKGVSLWSIMNTK